MRDFGTWDSICQQGSDSSIVEWTGKAERNFPQVLPVLHVYSLNETQYCKVMSLKVGMVCQDVRKLFSSQDQYINISTYNIRTTFVRCKSSMLYTPTCFVHVLGNARIGVLPGIV